MLNAVDGIDDIAMTSNAFFLKNQAPTKNLKSWEEWQRLKTELL